MTEPTRRWRGRVLAALVAALLLTGGVATPAAAHNGLSSADPADGTRLARTPEAVVLTFDEPAVSLGTQVLVTGPDGPAADGPAQLVDATVRQPLVDGAPGGTYTVDWRVTSADGHPVTGRLTFTSDAAGAGLYPGRAPTAVPVEAASTAWGWLGLAALLLAAAGTIAVRRRRRTGARTEPTAPTSPAG
jgi:methionine-rich copper-binding protein CopC